MTEFTTAIQLVVDTDKLLGQIGWRKRFRDCDGDTYEKTGEFDAETDLASEVAKILAAALKKDMAQVVEKTVTEVAREKVAAIIEEVMERGFHKTNGFGEPTGESITLRQLVIGEIEGQLQRRVDSNGRKPDSYNRASMTYLEYMAATAAREALNGELKAATARAVAEVNAKVKTIVADELGAKIAKTVGA